MFGNNKPTFGSSSTFGSPGSTLFGNQAKPAGSLFGQSTNTGSSLFGQKSTTNLFGSPSTQSNTGSIFGGTQQASNTGSSLFGQNKTSMFGGTNATSNTFGTTNNTSSGLFGSSTTSNTGSLFGGGGGGTNAPNGTTIKFNPPVAMDTMNKGGNVQNIQTKHYCITAMKDYESKSLEELRVDDYMANRKTPSTSGGLFGGNTSNTGSSLFGGNTNQQKPSLFGSSTNTTSSFGTNNTQSNSLFGGNTNNNNNNTGSSLFGPKPATTGLFGSTTQQTQSSFGGASSFGTNTNTSAFGGANNNNQQSSVFGNTSFGQNTSQPATGGGLFGNATTTAFGQPATNTGGGLFGSNNNNTSSSSLFGNKPAAAATNTGFSFGNNNATTSSFGNTANTGSLFGNNAAAKPGGLFGTNTTTNTTGSLFGNTAQPAQSGGLFGTAPAAQTGGLFGNNAAQNTSAVVQNPATVSVSAPVIVLGSDVNETQVKMAMINAQLAASPYGNSPLLKLTNDDSDDKPNPISVSRQMRFLAAKANGVNSPLNTSNAAGNTSINTSANTSTLKTSFLSGQAPVAGSKLRRSNVPSGQDLNYKSIRKPPTLGNGLRDKGSANVSLNESSLNISRNKITDVDAAVDKALSNNENVPGSRKKSNIKYLDLNSIRKSAISNSPKGRTNDPDELPCYSDSVVEVASPSSNPRDAALQREEALRREPPKLVLDQSSLDESALNTSQSSQMNNSALIDKNSSVIVSSPTSAPGGVTLSGPDYYCEPTIKEMTNMVVNGKVIIPNGLTVGRASYGSVFWPGKIELSNIALDEVIVFRHKEVTVYPDDSKKPSLGDELNKEAEVTLERVWHVDKNTKEEIRDPLILADIGWRDRLERVTAKMGAIFKDYRPASGSWVFKVEHFSKYGLPDNEGGDMVCDTPPVPPRDSVLTERNVQSKVQRASLQLEKGKNFNESVLEHEDDENQYVAKISKKPQKVLGLGGNNTFNLPFDDETMDYGEEQDIIEEEAPPEKKLKTEDVDMIYEETKRLLEVLSPVHYHARVVPKAIAPVRGFTGGVSAKNSIRTDGTSIDLASAHSNVSRVGWGTGGTYVVSLQPHCNSVYVKSLNWATEGCQNYISDMLEHNSRLSQFIKRNRSISAKVRHLELDGQEVSPRIKPTADHAELIDSFLATSKQSGFSEDTRVWKLCKALFPQNRGLKDDNDKIEDVSLWLTEEIAKEKRMPPSVGRGSSVWNALCDGQLSKAIDSAFNEKLHHLATYLSLFQIDPAATQMYFEEQIDFWKSTNSLAFVDVPVLKVYLLLAGRSSIDRKVKGKTEVVNCLEGLTWKQSVGVHVWWLRGVRTFEESMSHALKIVPAPNRVDDIFFQQIFALACDPTYRVEAVLDAADMLCDSPLDFHLSWHLWSVLRSVGYNTMPSEAEQRLHISYSEQLIACGLHDLALFVLSHISNNQCRASSMRDCLERIAPHSSSNLYDKINHEFYVPKQWIAEAKLVAALASKNNEKACIYAIEAGDLQTAHRLFVEDVAPNFVVLGETSRLIEFVKKFAPYSDAIQSWGQNGQIYADYAEFSTMCKVDCDETVISELLTTLQSRLRAPVFNTPLQRLAAQNMSLEIVEVLKLFGRVSFEFPLNPSQVDKVTRQLV
ncbi:unnamed protein product [Auanema sp. JU1783]|nr:unnamed protein product [Auanema sp. JU1783]